MADATKINWEQLRSNLRFAYTSRYKMQKAVPGLASSTANAAWNGKSVGLIPFLRLVKSMQHDPFEYMTEP